MTASDIVFIVKENISVTSNTTELSSSNTHIKENIALNPTLVYVKENDTWRLNRGNKVIMYDDTTKVEFSKLGVFTIVEVKDGKGADAGWGRLKSGAGWISLDYCKRV